MQPRPRAHIIHGIALALGATAFAIAALLAPAPARSAQENWVAKATAACGQAGGALTTPGGNVIFQCTFPPSINLADILGTRLLLRVLPKVCFHGAQGNLFGPIYSENAVACLVSEPATSAA
jgi:putative hemolysin